MYHVLIFQLDGKYKLDGEDPVSFDSLDDLIVFLVGHDMKIDEDEIHLKEIVPCSADSPTSAIRISSNGRWYIHCEKSSKYHTLYVFMLHFQLPVEVRKMKTVIL